MAMTSTMVSPSRNPRWAAAVVSNYRECYFVAMRSTEDTDEEVEPGVVVKGGPEALRPYLGKWIAVDEDGEIRASGTTFDEVASAAKVAKLREPEFVYLPAGSFVG
jgi:hypothetical protein